MSGISFQEQMRGTWYPKDTPDFSRPAQFDCLAKAPDLSLYLRDGWMHLSGFIRIEGLADLTKCQGSLRVLLPLGKRLQYELHFVGNDQKRYTLRGEKQVRFSRILKTMTYLPTQIFNEEQQLIGEARFFFDLNKIFSLVKSMILSLLPSKNRSVSL